TVHDKTYLFCSNGCAKKFDASPASYVKDAAPAETHSHNTVESPARTDESKQPKAASPDKVNTRARCTRRSCVTLRDPVRFVAWRSSLE
ncbi:MAG: hypothetical protein ABI551_21395, partial [Polyangiaceae bacterium]